MKKNHKKVLFNFQFSYTAPQLVHLLSNCTVLWLRKANKQGDVYLLFTVTPCGEDS